MTAQECTVSFLEENQLMVEGEYYLLTANLSWNPDKDGEFGGVHASTRRRIERERILLNSQLPGTIC